MRIIYSEHHQLHAPPFEFSQGQFISSNECPERANLVLEFLRSENIGEISSEKSHGMEKILAVHSAGMVDLLENGHTEWERAGNTGSAFPSSWPLQASRALKVPQHIEGRLAYYCADTATPLTKTSWRAIKASADCALTAADSIIAGEKMAFALCRPPGHHAAANSFGGFCFLNNAAIAAQHLLDQGARRIAILDIDYHHGNGTQDIFYNRRDVLTVSIHANPLNEYPFYWGHSDEIGEEEGTEFNLNLPLALGASWNEWSKALDKSLETIRAYKPDVLLVGLGVDTFKDDPISLFKLDSQCYPLIGQKIGELDLPTQFVMEGGYAVSDIGTNVVGVLKGYMQNNRG